jgi:hypothetical protein
MVTRCRRFQDFVWDRVAKLEQLSDFIEEGNEYKTKFEIPLDDATRSLRKELARIIGRKSSRDASATALRRN